MIIRLDCWSIVGSGTIHVPPEKPKIRLMGKVSGHPNFNSGQIVVTSPVSSALSGFVGTANGTVYRLSSVDPLYEEKYPSARARLFGARRQAEEEVTILPPL